MNYANSNNIAGMLTVILPIIFLLIIWSFIWKALALWRAARAGSKGWFVVLMLINTVGILEILYLYVFSKSASKNNSVDGIK